MMRRIEIWVDVDEDALSDEKFESLRKTLEKLSWWGTGAVGLDKSQVHVQANEVDKVN